MKKQAVFLVVVVLFALSFSLPGMASEQQEKPIVPNFTLESNAGNLVSLSDYAGKIVVLNFWASWCPPCRAEMKDFQQLADDLVESEDVVLLMLNQTDGQRETKEKAEQYLQDNGFKFLNLYDRGEVGHGIFGLPGIPTTVIIDKDGRLSGYVVGQTNYQGVRRLIEGAR